MTFDLTTAIADDAELFDGTQTVTLRVGDLTVSVANVTDSPLSHKQLMLIGGLAPETQTRSLSLPKVGCGSIVPTNESEIVDEDGVVWMIKDFDSRTLGTRYLCACVKSPTQISCPFAPVDFADNSSSNGVLRLTWTNRNPHATGLAGVVEYSAASDFSGATSVAIASVTGATITFSQSVTPGAYYVRARHSNSIGNSPYSAVVQVTVGAVLAITSSTTPTMAENLQFVQTLTATGGVAPRTFSIVGGADAAKFEITGGSSLSFIDPPDFETPTDANADNVYEVTVRVTDAASNTADATVSVGVTDVGD